MSPTTTLGTKLYSTTITLEVRDFTLSMTDIEHAVFEKLAAEAHAGMA